MTQEQQEEVKLLKELIADKSISADEREIYEDALNQLMKSEKPKATTSQSKPTTTQRKARTTPTKKVTPAKTKQTATDVEKAKAEIKAKTGKTEAECESIIEQYRALRTKAQEGKRKAEQASADNKERVGKLERKGDIIAGTNEKTADAVIESSTKDVAEKIEKEVEAVEAKAEKEAKAEVAKDKSITSAKDKKEAVEAIVDEKVKEKTKTIVKRVVIDTSALLTSIASSLGKFDKDSQKEFLIKLRSDIDKLLSKYAFGGMTDGATQVMNVQQSNMSSSSVNPSQFGNGGGVEKRLFALVDNFDEKNQNYDQLYYKNDDYNKVIYYIADLKNEREYPKNAQLIEVMSNGKMRKFDSSMLANGGGVYSSDELYILKVYDLNNNLVDSRRIFARNISKAKEIAIDDYESDMHEKYGRDLKFRIELAPQMMANGGEAGKYNQSWHQDHYRHNKGESYEVPVSKRKYSVGGTLLSGMVGAYVGYQYGKKGKKAFKFEDGGIVGQEIVFDYQGDEKTGVIKEISNSGDYIVSTEDGRMLLAQRDRDVISLGGMRKAMPMEAPRKRFGFFGDGGGVHTMPDGRVMLNSAHYEDGGRVKYYLNGFEESLNYIMDSTNAKVVSREGSKENGDLIVYFETTDEEYEYAGGGSVDDYIDEQEMQFATDRSKMRQQYGRENIKDIEYQGFLAVDENDERLSDYEFEGEEFDKDNLLEVAQTYPEAKYIVFHARLMGESDFGVEDELSPIDDLAMEFDMSRLNQYAKGGLTEHGLRVGDTIQADGKTFGYKDEIQVIDSDKKRRFVNLDKGNRGMGFGKGGKIEQIDKMLSNTTDSKKYAKLTNIRKKLSYKIRLSDADIKYLESNGIDTYANTSKKPTQSELNKMTAFNLMEAMKNDKRNYESYKKALLKLYPDAKGFAGGGGVDGMQMYFGQANVDYVDSEGNQRNDRRDIYIQSNNEQDAKRLFILHLENYLNQLQNKWLSEFITIELIKDPQEINYAKYRGFLSDKNIPQGGKYA
jgi:hypothetical protein